MTACGLVAQSVEHLTFNQRVMGSNPVGLTNKIKGLGDFTQTLIFLVLHRCYFFEVDFSSNPNRFHHLRGLSPPLQVLTQQHFQR